MVSDDKAQIVMVDGSVKTVAVSRVVYSAETAHLFEETQAVATMHGALALKPEGTGWVTRNFEVQGTHTYVSEDVRVHNLSSFILQTGHDYQNNSLVELLESLAILQNGQIIIAPNHQANYH